MRISPSSASSTLRARVAASGPIACRCRPRTDSRSGAGAGPEVGSQMRRLGSAWASTPPLMERSLRTTEELVELGMTAAAGTVARISPSLQLTVSSLTLASSTVQPFALVPR